MFTFPVGHHHKSSSGPPVGSLVHWVKADAGVTKDGSNIVSAWADQSGNGTNWGSPTGGNITWVASQINGLPVLRCPGGGARLEQPRFASLPDTTTSPAEVFVVLKALDPSTVYSWAGVSTESESSHYPYSGNTVYENFGIINRPSFDVTPAGADPCRSYNIYNISSGGASGSYVVRLKGIQVFPSSGSVTYSSGWASTFRLFASNATAPAGFGFHGDIAEILIYNGVLDSATRASTYSYLQTRYAL